MMTKTLGYAAHKSKAPLVPFEFERRALRDSDVRLKIEYSGVCHSDLHQVNGDWGGEIYPMVPGHEIIGTVTHVGSKVKEFRVGERVGVGCMVDSCRKCAPCSEHQEQYCANGFSGTYNSYEQDKVTPTYGGYASDYVVDQSFLLKVPTNLNPAEAAPLLCAGITTYSPLKWAGVGKGKKVGIIGIGGLGHMGIKIANALGAEVFAFTSSESKKEEALRLGAHEVVVTRSENAFKKVRQHLDFVLDTVSADHDPVPYMRTLKFKGSYVIVGVPPEPMKIKSSEFIFNRLTMTGSLIGGIKETQEMLDFCGEKNITATSEIIPIQKINEAYARLHKSDVKYRFVIDIASLT